MPELPIILYKGKFFIVECAVEKNGNSRSKEFLDNLDNANRAKILRIIKRFADYGEIKNRKQFKKVENNIWEFKHYQIRILMFHCAQSHIALTHGFKKKKNRIPKNEIERAKRIKSEYEEVRRGFSHG